jgi:nitrogen regulatory protein PII
MKSGVRDIRRITLVVNRDFLEENSAVRAVRECGAPSINYSTGRAVMLREHSDTLTSLFNRTTPLVSSPVDILNFYVEPEHETAALEAMAARFNLYLPGTGSVYSEEIRFEGLSRFDSASVACSARKRVPVHLQSQLTGICCIVLRGMGDQVARVALETGSCVPTITYGVGAGLRDRLGLWRVLISAEKEIVTMVVNSFEAEEIMNIIIDVAKIDQPGRGFIYMYPVRKGLINLKVSQSSRSQAASIEQVVLAIDELKGSADWRRRRLAAAAAGNEASRKHIVGLSELALHCDEGTGADFVRIAMEAGGAPGATITSYTAYLQPETGPKTTSPARESCSMVAATLQVIDILQSFEAAGVLDKENMSGIETREVFRAYSYTAK